MKKILSQSKKSNKVEATKKIETANAELPGAVIANEKGSALPYIFGWLLGVPGSILFLIFLVRNI